MSARRKPADGNAVRTWANENGFTLGSRGVLPADAIKAFEKANTGLRYTVGHTDGRTVAVATKDSRGRNRTAKVNIVASEARAFHGGKGRIPDAAYLRAAEAKLS